MFATFYEACMIPKKIGDKKIEFEVTIGMLKVISVVDSFCSCVKFKRLKILEALRFLKSKTHQK